MRRKALYAVALLGLAAYAWLVVAVYRSKADPENFKAWDGSGAWIVGPSGKELKKAADLRMDLALEVLDELDFTAYREHLLVAEDLLERSLRAQPGQPEVLARLAAVRWELKPALTDEGMAEYLELIETASGLAPHSPLVQFRLGRLLMAMGREDNALPYLRHAAHLRPQQTQEIADLLLTRGYMPPELLDLLPDEADVVASLGNYFRTEEDGSEEYLRACEAILEGRGEITVQFLSWYSVVGRRLREYQRLYDSLAARSFVEDSELEAERLANEARALSGLDRDEEAIAQASAAILLEPKKARYRESLGDVALAAEEFDLARKSYRDGIGIQARNGGGARYRAILYSKIGRSEEKDGRPDRAYDAYRIALDLDPEEWTAKSRMKTMREAAGISSPDPENE